MLTKQHWYYMSNGQAKTSIDIKKTRYALVIFGFFFVLLIFILQIVNIIDTQTLSLIIISALVVENILFFKLRGIEKEQQKQEKENSIAFPHYEQGKTSLDTKKARYAFGITLLFLLFLMFYLLYISVIGWQAFCLIMTSVLVVWSIIGFKLWGMEKEQMRREKENSTA